MLTVFILGDFCILTIKLSMSQYVVILYKIFGGGEKMEISILFAVLLLDNDIENTSIMQINLLERCDRLMLTVLLSNFKAVSHSSLTFVST